MAPTMDEWMSMLTVLVGDVKDMGTTKQPQIRIIVLEKGQHLDTVVRRLGKGEFVRFHRGGSLLGVEVEVRTSLTGDEPLKWTKGVDHLAVYCQVECTRAGAFKYTFTADGEECGSGYFLVMPELMVNGKRLPLDGIACQTHITKLLGSFSCWEDRLRVSKESGYNMIHLTPIHELGISNSSYSISDHHALIKDIQEENHQVTFEDVENLVQKIEKEWNMLTVQDVVWNHAAKNAQWLQEHPECAYNCLNSPHLRPAFVVDRVYHHFGREVSEGKWVSRGVPEVVDTVHHTNAIEYLLRTEVLPKIRLHEFFQVDVEANVRKFEEMAKEGASSEPLDECLPIAQDPEWRRFGSSVDWPRAMRIFNRHRDDATSEEDRIAKCASAFRDHLHFLNGEAGKEAWEILMAGLRAVMGHICYERLADHGPKHGAVTPKHPLTTDYFLQTTPMDSWEEEEQLAFDPDKSRFLMAFNGWVMCDNPLKNFALPDSQVYLRRELVCWGDSTKLNYGEKPEDCPFLWQYMKDYTQKCAKMFHGLRIDNAHSTPIHVAEYLLLAAREVRPDIYVFAELFTGSEEKDHMFVNRLGISSLVREAQSAHDSHEQGRLVYKFGGDVVGAMMQQSLRHAPANVAHAMFLDQSHDNPCPIQTRSVYDLLPTAAMVSMASCAVGSVRGYDELVPHQIHVVDEKRPYAKWGHGETTAHTGIVEARRILNELHLSLARANYSQVFVDQMSPDVVGITRHNPVTHDTVVVVAHTAFNKHQINKDRVYLKHIPIGELAFVLDSITLQDFNHLLFTSDAEERVSIDQGAYNVPLFGSLVYCGLQGLMPLLDQIRINNDLGHPLCANLRAGTWLCDYISERLEKNISTSSSLVKALAVSSVSFVGYVPNADLAPLPPSLRLEDKHPSSLAAGLPHFAVDIWRNWGRDTFIALPGCLLATGRNIILAYAGALRHGLIPNLLAEGKGARYNCRDAVWFWLHSIERYVKEAPSGQDILRSPVRRIYPNDDTVFGEDEREEPLINVMVEALQRHFSGIDFRERNAGGAIDEHMTDEGFNVKVYVDRATGFIHGGNRWNCGTWMDKMGSSDKAGNRGEPATPRDGAAVEIQALAYSVLQAMAEWSNAGVIDKNGVSHGDESWTWSDWATKINKNFEEHFFIDENQSGQFVNQKNILKDTVGSCLEFTDYQLRCNYVVALATAPSLMDPHKAWKALDAAKEHLLGPLGMKTLDPSDWAYNGDYNNNDDGVDKKTAKGWNYHQGPEWLWVAGSYLRARLAIGRLLGGSEWTAAQKEVQQRLGNYYQHIRESPWSSLPELTNSNGSVCGGSCPAQAWSVGTVLDSCLYFVDLLGSSH
ncbi:hypothetical protein GCK32_003796 [Trichostrongylus colubriformis]|uniref:4-alpha-glucanotransferase n=1 Tax=Trichostrongylus colubriformis TaxID=6319 RepID=A0AAN8IPK7_TRICO